MAKKGVKKVARPIRVEPEITPTLPVEVEIVPEQPRYLIIRGNANDFAKLERDALDDGWRPLDQAKIVQSVPELVFEREFSH